MHVRLKTHMKYKRALVKIACFEMCTVTYSIEQSPSWEANRFAFSQEIPHILSNPKVHYRIHNCSLPVSILSQLIPVPYAHIPIPEDPP
jgi:hypothetical protein